MIELKQVCFTYANGADGGLKDIDLTVKSGECILLCGTLRMWENNNYPVDKRLDSGILFRRIRGRYNDKQREYSWCSYV